MIVFIPNRVAVIPVVPELSGVIWFNTSKWQRSQHATAYKEYEVILRGKLAALVDTKPYKDKREKKLKPDNNREIFMCSLKCPCRGVYEKQPYIVVERIHQRCEQRYAIS